MEGRSLAILEGCSLAMLEGRSLVMLEGRSLAMLEGCSSVMLQKGAAWRCWKGAAWRCWKGGWTRAPGCGLQRPSDWRWFRRAVIHDSCYTASVERRVIGDRHHLPDKTHLILIIGRQPFKSCKH